MEEISRVLVSAEPTTTNSTNQHAETMTVVFELRHKLRIHEHQHNRAVESNITTREFSLPLAAFASAAAARPTLESALSELGFRFPRGTTQWASHSDDDDAPHVPLDGLRGVAARVSELGATMLSSNRGASMLVRIRKLTVLEIPQDALTYYEPLLLFHQHRGGGEVRGGLAEYYVAAVNAEIAEFLGGHVVAPEGLETVRYEGHGDGDESNNMLTCAICIDELAIGCHVTRLPCSHRFHEDCIGKWLKKSSDCPLCRSRL